MIGIALYFGFKLLRDQRDRAAVDYPFLKDDLLWDVRGLRFFGASTFVAGTVAGMIGIGGAMLLGPLFLVMGVDPRVSSATNAMMVVPTSSIVAVVSVVSGLVPWSYAVFYFFVCFFGALLLKSLIDACVKRTSKASLLVLILATIIAVSTVGVFYVFFTGLADKGWCLEGFNQFCKVMDEEMCPVEKGRLLASSFKSNEFEWR